MALKMLTGVAPRDLTGETFAGAGIREVYEETGLNVCVGEPISTIEAIYQGNA